MKHMLILSLLLIGNFANNSHNQSCDCRLLEGEYLIDGRKWILKLIENSPLDGKVFKFERVQKPYYHESKTQRYVFNYNYCEKNHQLLKICYTDSGHNDELVFFNCYEKSLKSLNRVCVYTEVQLKFNGSVVGTGKLNDE